MATKSRKPKPFLAWLCFFLAFNLSLALLAAGLYLYGHFPLYSSYSQTDDFQVALYKFSAQLQDNCEQLLLLSRPEEEFENTEDLKALHETYGEDFDAAIANLIAEFNAQYNNADYSFTHAGGLSFNSDGFDHIYQAGDGQEKEWFAQNYAFTLYFDGTVFEGIMNHENFSYTYGQAIRNLFFWNDPGLYDQDVSFFLAVPEQLDMGDNFYLAYQSWEQTRTYYFYLAGGGLAALILWILTLLSVRSLSLFQKKLAGLFKHILLEAKLALLILWGRFSYQLLTAKLFTGESVFPA